MRECSTAAAASHSTQPASSTSQLTPSPEAIDWVRNTRTLLSAPCTITAGHTDPDQSRSATMNGAHDAIASR